MKRIVENFAGLEVLVWFLAMMAAALMLMLAHGLLVMIWRWATRRRRETGHALMSVETGGLDAHPG